MVKLASTVEEYKKCREFLAIYGEYPLPFTILFYIEEKDILCVGGYHKDYGAMLEPMQSKTVKASLEMYKFFTEYLKTLGHITFRFKTTNEKLIALMKKHFKFVEQKSTYLVKEL